MSNLKIASERGKDLIVLDEFKFRFHKNLANNVKRWTCSKNTCKSYLKTDHQDNVIENPSEHNHAPCEVKDIQRQGISNVLKRRAIENICDRPLKILHKHLSTSTDVSTMQIDTNDLFKIRRNMCAARNKALPKLPQNLKELHEAVGEYEKVTEGEEPFLLVNDAEKNIILFSTISNLKYLGSSKTIFVDGTFKSSPTLFTQLFTIHAFKHCTYIPLVFCLLPDKKQENYEAVFRHLRCKMAELEIEFEPEVLFADFEIAIHNAVSTTLPNCMIKGCRFHLAQSWWRRIQTLGLSIAYKKKEEEEEEECDEELGSFLRLFFGLPFLTSSEVEDFFTDELMAIQPDNEKVQKFCDYILENYILPDSKFPPEMWADYTETTTRTTNACESFHARLNALIPSPHPNIFKLIAVLLGFQAETMCKMNQANNVKRRKVILRKERVVASLMKRLAEGNITKMQFIAHVSMKFLPLFS